MMTPLKKAHQVIDTSESGLEAAGFVAKTRPKSPGFCRQSDSYLRRLPFFRGVNQEIEMQNLLHVSRNLLV